MIDQILITDMTEDEWTESAENEPDADEADREWAQALTDETEDEQC